MAEFIRSIKVRVEVDTTKQTYVLDIDDELEGDDVDSAEKMGNLVTQFIEHQQRALR
ncbi:MAG TPA: hypothetical protein VLZ78_12330 [Terrimesophilobacter sp.]|nr:hypothetical protein [Terrimesophilobacter sp.]